MVRTIESQRLETNRQKVVLVVEDEILIRNMISEFLRAEGYTVVEAFNADEAISIFLSGKNIDIVLSDIDMPSTNSVDGIDLAIWVSQNHPGIPIILTSGHGHAARAAGIAQVFLPKPYRMLDTVLHIRALLKSSDQGDA